LAWDACMRLNTEILLFMSMLFYIYLSVCICYLMMLSAVTNNEYVYLSYHIYNFMYKFTSLFLIMSWTLVKNHSPIHVQCFCGWWFLCGCNSGPCFWLLHWCFRRVSTTLHSSISWPCAVRYWFPSTMKIWKL